MARKCMDQMPIPPSEAAAQTVMPRSSVPSLRNMDLAHCRASSAPQNEIRYDSNTSAASYLGVNNWPSNESMVFSLCECERQVAHCCGDRQYPCSYIVFNSSCTDSAWPISLAGYIFPCRNNICLKFLPDNMVRRIIW